MCRDCSGKSKDKILGTIGGDCDIEFEDIIDKHYEMICPYHTSALVMHREYATKLPAFYNTAARYGFGDLPRAIWYTISGKIRLFF